MKAEHFLWLAIGIGLGWLVLPMLLSMLSKKA